MRTINLVLLISACMGIAGCEYIANATSGGGKDGAELAKDAVSADQVNDAVDAINQDPNAQQQDEPLNMDNAGSVQNSSVSNTAHNVAGQIRFDIENQPEISVIIDDWGNQCPRQNSEFCGGYGVALVPAHDAVVGSGMACGPGTAEGMMVVNYEWVNC